MDTVIPICGQATNCYLVQGRSSYLVDTNAPLRARGIERELAKHGGAQAISCILITHCHFDHVGNLAEVKAASGARVLAGADDVPYIQGDRPPAPMSNLNRLGRLLQKVPWLTERYQRFSPARVDEALHGGEVLAELGLEVVALPGHTRGAMGFVDRAARRAFVGDSVSHWFGRIGLPTLSASYSLELIEASMRKLVALDLDLMYPGHGPVIGPRASEELARFVAKRFG